MSRTYRCRHLPKVAHRRWCGRWAANKVVDGGGHYRRNWKEIEAEVAEIVGYSKPDYKQSYGYTKTGTHTESILLPEPKNWKRNIFAKDWLTGLPRRWEWEPQARRTIICKGAHRPTQLRFEWDRAHDFVEHNKVWDVQNWHPYARKRNLNRHGYGEERRRVNRMMRRRNRQVIQANMCDDDWDGDWAEPDLYLNKRWFMD